MTHAIYLDVQSCSLDTLPFTQFQLSEVDKINEFLVSSLQETSDALSK